jgi:hypothetical protein
MLSWLNYLLNAKWVLRGRVADRALCQVPGVDDRITEQALTAICGAFLIPKKQRYCLRPDDTLMSLYLDGAKRRWGGDDLEFTHLWLYLDETLEVALSDEEIQNLNTVGDVIRVIARNRRE